MTAWLVCRTTVEVGVESAARPVLLPERAVDALFRREPGRIAGTKDHLDGRQFRSPRQYGGLARPAAAAIDFLGAVVIFATIDRLMTATLAAFVVAVTAGLIWFGERGRPLHRAYSGQAAGNGGDLVDTIANMWTVKAFSARRPGMAPARPGIFAQRPRRSDEAGCISKRPGSCTTSRFGSWPAACCPGPSTFGAPAGDAGRCRHRVQPDLPHPALVEGHGALAGRPRPAVRVHRGDAGGHRRAPDGLRRCRMRRLWPVIRGEIEFRQVDFGYGQGRNALHEIDLVIPARQKVGIVGPSGAGKSTLVHLLQRLHDVSSGRNPDRWPAASPSVTQDTLRAALAVVPQEITLLHRSVMDNIRFARPHASDAEVYAAAPGPRPATASCAPCRKATTPLSASAAPNCQGDSARGSASRAPS